MLPPRAYVFIGLNAIRALSVIGLLLLFSSSIVTMVHDVEAVNRFVAAGKDSGNATALLDCDYIAGSTVPNQPAGAFWAVLNRLLITFQIVALLLSELSLLSAFFARFFPVLGPDFGLGPLGVIQCLLGAAVLSHHVDDFALVAAFFVFALGCVNILLGLVFRDKARTRRSLRAWRERAKDVLPSSVTRSASAASSLASTVYDKTAGAGAGAKEEGAGDRWRGFGFGRQGEKKAGMKGFLISRPLESLPRYAGARASAA